MTNNQLKEKACYLLIGFFCFIVQFVSAQDQKIADSLARIYQKNELRGEPKMELLRQLSANERRDLKLGLQYAEELISLAMQKNNQLFLYRGYFLKGSDKKLMGDMDEALDAYFKSADAAIKAQ